MHLCIFPALCILWSHFLKNKKKLKKLLKEVTSEKFSQNFYFTQFQSVSLWTRTPEWVHQKLGPLGRGFSSILPSTAGRSAPTMQSALDKYFPMLTDQTLICLLLLKDGPEFSSLQMLLFGTNSRRAWPPFRVPWAANTLGWRHHTELGD